MKKLSFLAIAFAVIAMTACGGKKSAQAEESADSVKSFEQEQIEASIKMHMDSIASDLGKLPSLPFLSNTENGIALTKEEKQVKPDYLLPASLADEATTLTEKYRALSALAIDKRVAALYEMPVEDYEKAVTKLAADINDPSFKAVENAGDIFETTEELYDEMEKNGRINFFWQLAASSLVEELYIANQNTDKFLSNFTDEAASNVTFRIVLILDAINRLSQFDPDIIPVAKAIAPLNTLNATTVAEMKEQMARAKDQIAEARKTLLK